VLSYFLGQIKRLSILQSLLSPPLHPTPTFDPLSIKLMAYVKVDIQCRTSANVIYLSGELSY